MVNIDILYSPIRRTNPQPLPLSTCRRLRFPYLSNHPPTHHQNTLERGLRPPHHFILFTSFPEENLRPKSPSNSFLEAVSWYKKCVKISPGPKADDGVMVWEGARPQTAPEWLGTHCEQVSPLL